MSFKLYYFNTRGLIEPTRMMLSYGGIDFEDIRIPLEVEQIRSGDVVVPEEIKQKCKWGQVPLLEFEGKRLNQSMAIGRYLARRLGLMGSNDFEAAKCDEYVDTLREATLYIYAIVKEKDEAKVPGLRKEVPKICREKYLAKFEEIARENGGNGRLVGEKLSSADISFFYLIDHMEIMTGIQLLTDDHPCLKKIYENVLNEPKIKSWREKRPKTLC